MGASTSLTVIGVVNTGSNPVKVAILEYIMRKLIITLLSVGILFLPINASILFLPINAKTVVIGNDNGGYVTTYILKYDNWDNNGTKVILKGICYSSCAYVTRMKNACAMPGAVLAFHAARYKNGGTNAKIIAYAFSKYPKHVRDAINKRGGIKKKFMFFRATDLMKACK